MPKKLIYLAALVSVLSLVGQAQAQDATWTDATEDCIVEELDQATMMENWLKCNALDCPDPEAP